MNEPLSSRLSAALYGYLGLIVAMLATGAALSSIYKPERSHTESTFRPAIETGIWKFLAAFHYWGSAMLFAVSGILIVWLFLTGFQGRSRALWFPVLATSGLCLALQVLGNALPMDRHDVQTVNIEASIAARTPLVGELASSAMLGGEVFAESTIALWYKFSIVAVALLIAVSFWMFVRLRAEGKVKFDISDRLLAVVALLVPVIAAILLPRATGELFLPDDMTSQSANPSWYVLPMHALLHLFDNLSPSLGWIGSSLIPGFGAGALVVAPIWAKNLSGVARRNLVLGAVAGIGLLVGTIGSPPAPISGNQHVYDIQAGKNGGPVDKALVAAGRTEFDKTCAGCHGQGGKGGPGGPPVNAVFKKTNDPQWFMDFIRNPSSKKPGSTMPAFKDLPEQELKAIAEWLRSEK